MQRTEVPTNECLSIKLFIEKEYSKTYLVTDSFTNFNYVVKKGDKYIKDEYQAYLRLISLDSNIVNNSIPDIYKYYENTIIMEYINGYAGYELDKIDALVDKNDYEKYELSWLLLIMQLAFFIERLERQKIQHNDFHLGNFIVTYDKDRNRFHAYIIDLETVTDYYDKKVFSTMMKTASKEEMIRMGWSDYFHPGSDLNQMLGEMIERYENIMPDLIVKKLKKRIIKYDKEFPYAISEENKLTTGNKIIALCFKMIEKYNDKL